MSNPTQNRFLVEVAIAASIGVICAVTLDARILARVDEMLVTFLSIVLAAVIPGIALTAASPRPPVSSPREALRFGARLASQARFWFGFLWTGGIAVGLLVIGRAIGWHCPTPRFANTPPWVPYGDAWPIFFATAAVAFVVVRMRHALTAVDSLIAVGTEVHAHEAAVRASELQEKVDAQIKAMPIDPERGRPLGDRPRH